jgi:hypothetical protein
MKFLFWKRKEKPAKQSVVAASNADMENNTVVLWSQRWLIDFIDAFLMRWCQFSLMIGCILGTFGLYATSFNLTAQPAFNGVWAAIQAVSIDGLFFAVWSVWRRSSGKGWLRAWYFFIGVLLMIVAAMVNGVVSYTELHKVGTIAETMIQLHINETVFSWSRSVLVVLVAVLITTLPRGKQESVPTAQPEVQTPAINTEKILETVQEMQVKSMQEMLNQFKVVTVELVEKTVERHISTIAVPQIEAPLPEITDVDEGSIQCDTSQSVEVDQSPIRGDTYALRIEQLYQENNDISVAEIVAVTGCARSTATKWLNRVKPLSKGE